MTKSIDQQLETAIQIAVNAHFGQRDKAGQPYITHPLRLMMNATSMQVKIVAVLHDVVEDTGVTYNDLLEAGIDIEMADAVLLLTHTDAEEDYMDYIRRIQVHPLAKEVKMLDLTDNMNLMRMSQLKNKDWARLQKYHAAYQILAQAI